MKELNNLIAICVLKQIMFAGHLGSQSYTVQDLLHGINLNSLNNMWKGIKKELSALDTDSLYKNPSTAKKKQLELKLSTIEAIFEYRQDLAKKEQEKAKAKEEAVKKLTILTHAKDAQEIDRIQNLSPKKLAKEIAEAEKLAQV